MMNRKNLPWVALLAALCWIVRPATSQAEYCYSGKWQGELKEVCGFNNESSCDKDYNRALRDCQHATGCSELSSCVPKKDKGAPGGPDAGVDEAAAAAAGAEAAAQVTDPAAAKAKATVKERQKQEQCKKWAAADNSELAKMEDGPPYNPAVQMHASWLDQKKWCQAYSAMFKEVLPTMRTKQDGQIKMNDALCNAMHEFKNLCSQSPTVRIRKWLPARKLDNSWAKGSF